MRLTSPSSPCVRQNAAGAEPVLELRGLTRRFGSFTAVDKVSLAVSDGEMVAVLGRSGAGKSTLLNMINRLVDPSEGEILYQGRDIARLSGAELLAWRRQSASRSSASSSLQGVPRKGSAARVAAISRA